MLFVVCFCGFFVGVGCFFFFFFFFFLFFFLGGGGKSKKRNIYLTVCFF